MKPREIERALFSCGFRVVRNGRKHRIWEGPGGVRTITSHGLGLSLRTERALRSLLRKVPAKT